MKILLALYKYFPYGGLQKDTVRFAEEALSRGHETTVLCTSWEGERIPGLRVIVISVRGMSNHGRMEGFLDAFVREREAGGYDVSLAMNRIPGADFYFVADSCMGKWMSQRHSKLALTLFPRYRTYLRHEALISSPFSHTRLLYIAERQAAEYKQHYTLVDERLEYLPPGMDVRCLKPVESFARRQAMRRKLGISDETQLWLLVGTNLHRKGADRVMAALGSLPAEASSRVCFCIVGNDRPEAVARMAVSHGVSEYVRFLGARFDVPDLLLAADLMVHPAREEGTGTVLIEGLSCGVPVICTEECGFSPFVAEATGTVIKTPFSHEALVTMLENAMGCLPELRERTLSYALKQDFVSRSRRVVELLEDFVLRSRRLDLSCMHYRSGAGVLSFPDTALLKHIRHGDIHWSVFHVFPAEALDGILELHHRATNETGLLKNEGKHRVSRVVFQSTRFIVKEYYRERRPVLLRRSRIAWMNSLRLREFTAPCLGYGLNRSNGSSYLVFADIGQDGLYHRGHHSRSDLLLIYRDAGSLMAELHQSGVFHADSKSTNFVINDLCPWVKRRVLMIDCDHVSYGRLSHRQKVWNLAQFMATTGNLPEVMRDDCVQTFSTGYREQSGLSIVEMEQMLEDANDLIHHSKRLECNLPWRRKEL